MGHTEISIIEWTDRNFCMPHYRNFWHKVDETSQCLEIERCSHKGKCAKQKWNCRHRLALQPLQINIYARRPLNLNPRSNNISLLLRRKQESRRLYLPSKSIKDTHDLSLPWNWALQPRRQMREAKAESRAPPLRAHVHHGCGGAVAYAANATPRQYVRRRLLPRPCRRRRDKVWPNSKPGPDRMLWEFIAVMDNLRDY